MTDKQSIERYFYVVYVATIERDNSQLTSFAYVSADGMFNHKKFIDIEAGRKSKQISKKIRNIVITNWIEMSESDFKEFRELD